MHDWKTSRTGLIPAHAGKTASSPPLAWRPAAHPRSRGENVVRENLCRNPSGSSPLTRGKPVRVGHAYWWSGLIPAHAGKTSSLTDRQTPRPAHPRSRGENVATEAATSTSTGSSPLTRGKPFLDLVPAEAAGLIPAHAGKTRPRRTHPRPRGAHPRSRGENPLRLRSSAAAAGSSPLTRGKQPGSVDATDAVRLIPAHAGKTYAGCCGRCDAEAHPRSRGENTATPAPGVSKTTAHPRSRGENSHVIRMSPSAFGSSPLTRGKRGGGRRSRRGGRLIPAHAGKTAPGIVFRWSGWAHPRSRGENRRRYPDSCRPQGSSPLTRGKRRCRGGNRGHERLIPAHAGKTRQWGRTPASRGAHPRSRGENRILSLMMCISVGSSPLTRGKPPW